MTKYLAVAAGFLAGLPVLLLTRRTLPWKNTQKTVLLALIYSGVSTLSALLFAFIEAVLSGQGASFGAISVYGVYLLAPLFLFLVFRLMQVPYRDGFDLFTLYVPPSIIIMRLNCLFSGCCIGTVIPGTSVRWPVREAEIIFYLLAFVCFLKSEKKTKKAGRYFPLLLVSYGLFRFIIEWFRESESASRLHLAHLWSLIAVTAGLSILFEINSLKHKGNKKEKNFR